MATVCRRVQYTGRVQGVGFRYTAQAIAAKFEVAGYVRNLPGGEVELVAEGADDQVAGYLATLADRMRHYIDETHCADEPALGLTGFAIRR